MAITKTIEIGLINAVSQHRHVHVRTDTVVKEDGTELSRTFHRHVLNPGTLDESDNLVDTDISGEDADVQAVCNAVWTDAVKTSWVNFLKETK